MELIGLLLRVAIVAVATLAAHQGSSQRWRLPLSIGPNDNTGALAIAADDTTLYAADTRGTIFALETKTGRVLWSVLGSAYLEQIFVFPSIPALLYCTEWDLGASGQLTLRALRKNDGTEVARMHNLTTSSMLEPGAASVLPTKYGLAVLHNYGLFATDAYLNVRWKVDNAGGSPSSRQWFNHLATSDTLVGVVRRTGFEWTLERALSFDAETGVVVCNISNASASLLSFLSAPFLLSADGWSLMDYTLGISDSVELVPRAVDLQRCGMHRTARINSWALAGGAVLIPTTDRNHSPLFFSISRSAYDGLLWINWTITHSRIGSDGTIWNLTLPSPPLDPFFSGSIGQPPLLSKASGIDDAVLLWYLGSFSAIDTATGAVRWSLAPTTVPTSPPLSIMDPQTVFPLGDGGRLFIPNLLGYTIVDTYSGDVQEVNFAEPILATLQSRDSTTEAVSVVFVTVDGVAVGV